MVPVGYNFMLNGDCILKSQGFVYLGLPIGSVDFVEEFYLEKMRSCEKALYSMKNIGCNPYSRWVHIQTVLQVDPEIWL